MLSENVVSVLRLSYIFLFLSPELKVPPPLTPEGQPVQPVQEQTFFQKYWMHIIGILLLISESLYSFTYWSLTKPLGQHSSRHLLQRKRTRRWRREKVDELI